MESSEKIVVVVAETAPVISAGLTSCLKRLTGMQIQPIEVHSAEDLADCISTLSPDLIIVNPTFSGSFDPEKFRMEHSGKYGLIAIQSALTDRNVARNFDEVISIVDDMDTIRRKIERLIDDSSMARDEEKETLSQREKEIVTLVVKGMTNKEIADKLFLSVHTVITHRRNIARKLEIHSATGLTIYAIVNHLVDLSEIKL